MASHQAVYCEEETRRLHRALPSTFLRIILGAIKAGEAVVAVLVARASIPWVGFVPVAEFACKPDSMRAPVGASVVVSAVDTPALAVTPGVVVSPSLRSGFEASPPTALLIVAFFVLVPGVAAGWAPFFPVVLPLRVWVDEETVDGVCAVPTLACVTFSSGFVSLLCVSGGEADPPRNLSLVLLT